MDNRFFLEKCNGEKLSFQQMMLEQLDIHMQEYKPWSIPYTFYFKNLVEMEHICKCLWNFKKKAKEKNPCHVRLDKILKCNNKTKFINGKVDKWTIGIENLSVLPGLKGGRRFWLQRGNTWTFVRNDEPGVLYFDCGGYITVHLSKLTELWTKKWILLM